MGSMTCSMELFNAAKRRVISSSILKLALVCEIYIYKVCDSHSRLYFLSLSFLFFSFLFFFFFFLLVLKEGKTKTKLFWGKKK
jgi:hypothetical protein